MISTANKDRGAESCYIDYHPSHETPTLEGAFSIGLRAQPDLKVGSEPKR